jgi:acetyl esterase/lipase
MLQASERQGWIFITVDYRLLPQANGLDILEDVVSAWDFIHTQLSIPGFTVQKKKVIVSGGSAGKSSSSKLHL